MQSDINEIVGGFLSGIPSKRARAEELYKETFDLDEIQSDSVRCGTIVPKWFLEFDRNHLELLEESLSLERMKELESGAKPTPEEQETYRELRLSQAEDGDIDADYIPGFWIQRIADSNGDGLFALTTVIGYSFNGIETEFHGLFLFEKDCIEYLKQHGVVIGG